MAKAISVAEKKEKARSKTAVRDTECGSITTKTSHPLNKPMKRSEMSKADKVTLRAWKHTYKTRDERVD